MSKIIPNHTRVFHLESEIIDGVIYDDGREGPGIAYKTGDFLKINPEIINADIETKLKRKPNARIQPFWLYVLKLQNKKYYVGITAKKNPYDRILQHGDMFGARWTAKYKPVEVMEVRDIGATSKVEAEGYEQNLTWEYMKRYGHKNVRGGNATYTGRIFIIGGRIFYGWSIKQFLFQMSVLALIAFLFYQAYIH